MNFEMMENLSKMDMNSHELKSEFNAGSKAYVLLFFLAIKKKKC